MARPNAFPAVRSTCHDLHDHKAEDAALAAALCNPAAGHHLHPARESAAVSSAVAQAPEVQLREWAEGMVVAMAYRGDDLRLQVACKADVVRHLYPDHADAIAACESACRAVAVKHGVGDPFGAPDVSLPPDAQATVQPAPERPDLALSPAILDDFVLELHGRGVVGEDRFAKVVYLCVTSRLLGRPVSLAAKGPSSAGKSFIVERVLGFFPQSAYYALSAMSERALAYSQEPLSHRMLVLYEAAGLEGDFASYLVRSLLSEGCIRYETVEKVKGQGLAPRLIVREGPTGLIVTTTAVSLHPENETRLLSVPANDTPEQTKQVIMMLACEGGLSDDDRLDVWHQLQGWLERQDNRVVIPFAAEIAELVPPVAVRLRRDFATVLNLVKAHAILHQATRDRDERGRVVARLDDYATVRSLVADLVADEVEAAVPATVCETVAAVGKLAAQRPQGVTYLQLADELGLDKSSAMRRARVATSRGYLKNLETRRGQPAKLVVGEPLPGELEILPHADRLRGCAPTGGRDT